MTNHAGAHQANYNYDSWGQNIQPTVPPIGLDTLGTENKFKFTGEALDPQTNLYYLRARYYDPTVGRFISKDRLSGALAVPLSRNRYIYALANPIGLLDPSGFAAIPSGDLSGGSLVHSGAIISTIFAGGFGFIGSGPGIPTSGPTGPPQQPGPPFVNIGPPWILSRVINPVRESALGRRPAVGIFGGLSNRRHHLGQSPVEFTMYATRLTSKPLSQAERLTFGTILRMEVLLASVAQRMTYGASHPAPILYSKQLNP